MKITFQWLKLVASITLFLFSNSATSQTLADVSAGKQRAATCFACHGEDGVSKIPGTPHLAGQDRVYLEKALKGYRDGTRQDPTMTAMSKPLSDRDITNIAAYFHLAIKDGRGQMLSEALATQQRIQPVAKVAMAQQQEVRAAETNVAPPEQAKIRSGKDIYTVHCLACHGTGAAGAPKLGDKAAWEPHLAQGAEAMLASAIKGKGAMPAKGTCGNCTDEELQRTIDYLVQGE